MYPFTSQSVKVSMSYRFGLDVYMVRGNEPTREACLAALQMGYRHIDTAHAYQNEHGVGAAVRKSGIPREEIWITSKLWPSEYGLVRCK